MASLRLPRVWVLFAVACATFPALIEPPALAADTEGPAFLADMTADQGTTGDSFTFYASVQDPSGIFAVQVRYSYDSGPEIAAAMTATDLSGTNWTYATALQRSAHTLHFMYRAQDKAGNWAESQLRYVSIADNDPPELLADASPDYAPPGSAYTFAIDLTDNTAVADAWIVYRFGSDPSRNLTLARGHPLEAQLFVPSTGVTNLTYRIEAVDPSGNSYRSAERTVMVVKDTSPPEFGRDSSSPTASTGDLYGFVVEVTDNVSMAEVRVTYRFGNGTQANRSLTLNGTRIYALDIQVPIDSTAPLNYSFYAADGAGNWARTRWRLVDVRDVASPVAEAGPDQAVMPGQQVTLNGTGSHDNIGIVDYVWEYTLGKELRTATGPRPTIQRLDAGWYRIILTVRDAAGNEAQDGMNVTVGDVPVDDGEGTSGPHVMHRAVGPPTAVVAGVAAIVTVAYLAPRLLRRRRRGARGTGPRSTSRRSQVGYSSTK